MLQCRPHSPPGTYACTHTCMPAPMHHSPCAYPTHQCSTPARLLRAPPMSSTLARLTHPSFHPPVWPVHRHGGPPTRLAHPLTRRWCGSHTHVSCMAHLHLAHAHLTCLCIQLIKWGPSSPTDASNPLMDMSRPSLKCPAHPWTRPTRPPQCPTHWVM